MKTHPSTGSGQAGYIALVSAIIIALLLLALALGIGFSSIFGRLNILDSESKERSLALAEACVNTAILNLAQGSTATGSVTVGSDSCSILSVQNNTSQATFKTQGVINKAYTTLKVTVDNTSFSVISWQECPTAVTAPCP